MNGITFPGRFRFTQVAGRDHHHCSEAAFVGLLILTVNEHYLDSKSGLELPFGVSGGPKVDQAANLGLWAGAVWYPAIWVTDPRVG